MPDISYVCLSDLHFGADNSLLTFVAQDNKVDTRYPSPVLEPLVDCLRQLGASNTGRRPRLVLAGDVLDLALSPDADAIRAFDHFVGLAFGGPDPVFDDTVYFVPGNHDHHLWETAREELYTEYLRPSDRPVTAPWHVTRMFDAPERGDLVGSRHGAPSPLLQTIVERHAGVETKIWTVYPNLGFFDKALGRAVVIHHGHYVEPTYRLMSKLRDMLFADQPRQKPMTMADLEAENFAWVDFLWSTLGRSGDAGQDVKLIYQLLQDEDALTRRVGVLSASIGELWPGARWGSPPRRVFAAALRALLSMPIRRMGKPARFAQPVAEAGGLPITAKVLEGVPLYLGSFALPQLQHELHTQPAEISYIFGHTHKPFERPWPIPGVGRPMSVFNTGGWVVDTVEGEAKQGASIVVVDDQLQVAAVRCYNQPEPAGGPVPAVSVKGLPTSEEFRGKLAASIDADQSPWSDLTAILGPEIQTRHELLASVVQANE